MRVLRLFSVVIVLFLATTAVASPLDQALSRYQCPRNTLQLFSMVPDLCDDCALTTALIKQEIRNGGGSECQAIQAGFNYCFHNCSPCQFCANVYNSGFFLDCPPKID